MQKLIEQLLDYNRKLADGPTELEDVALDEIIDIVLSSHSLTARAKLIHTAIDLQVTRCRAEPTLLMRVIDNLYSNAVHYGSESGNIWLRSYQQGQRIFIDVANTGTPIPPEEQAMIFEPFFQGSLHAKVR